MAIKSKSKLTFIVWLLLTVFGLSGLMAVMTNGSPYIQESYFESEAFAYQLNQYVSMLHVFELNTQSAEEMKKEINVTRREIEEHRTRYGNLGEQISNISMQYEQQIKDAASSGNKAAEAALVKERDKKIADITENFNSDEHVRAKIIKEKEQRIDEFFNEVQKHQREYRNMSRAFKFYLKDAEGKVYTNLNISTSITLDEGMNKKEMYGIQNYSDILQRNAYTGKFVAFMPYNEVAEELLRKQNNDFTGEIGLSKSAPATHPIITEYNQYEKIRTLLIGYVIASIGALMASFIIAKKENVLAIAGFENWKAGYDRIPIDIRAVILAATGWMFASALIILGDQFIYFTSNVINSLVEIAFMMLVSAVLLLIFMIQAKFLAADRSDWKKLNTDLKRSVAYKTYFAARSAFLKRSVGIQLILLLGVVFFLGGLAAGVLIEPMFFMVFGAAFVVLGLPALYLIFRNAGRFNQIVKNTEELAAGNMGTDLPVKGKSIFAELAADMNTLRQAVKVSYREQAKSERLKTELITNVSHDLRTPLTSIITYSELLKTPDLAAEDRDAYIQIIDRKSKRLKVLIDDLFEASKMASGNIELNKEKVDLNQLLEQALAEHSETLKESSLQLRVSKPDEPMYAFVDGQKIWRVFDNLIGNILKYSLEHSRVFISIKSEHEKAVLTFKNVTKYELGENLDELFERFKRGDQSRHTEGSGLGLAIAKSIVDLHEGSLDIEVDGDLFKVIVKLEKMS